MYRELDDEIPGIETAVLRSDFIELPSFELKERKFSTANEREIGVWICIPRNH